MRAIPSRAPFGVLTVALLASGAVASGCSGPENAGQAGTSTSGSGTTAGAPVGGAGGGGTGGAGATTGGISAGGSVGSSGAAGTAGAEQAGTAGMAGGGGSGAPACSSNPAVTFSENIRVNDDNGNGNQAEVTLATGPNGLAVAAWGDSRGQRTCSFSVSRDGGRSWGTNVAIANEGGSFVGDPAAAIDAGGTIYAVCQQYGTGFIRLMTSTDQGDSWSDVRSIQSAPDKPWAGGGDAAGTVFVSWLGNAAGIKRSTDSGQTWGPTQSLGNIIHGTAIVTSSSGLVHVPYNLDSDDNQLRYLRSRDGGDSWEQPRDLVEDMGGFCFQCSPRQHPIVGAAADPTGQTVAITWSSRMPGGEGDDDIWLLFSKDGGDSWTDPLRVNDNAQPSRQFQPWVAVDGCGRVHVAWTDTRNGKNEVWYARSLDPTQGFEPNVQVTDDSGSVDTDFLGDYKGVAISGSDVLMVWQDTRRDSGDIYAARALGVAAL